MTSVLLILGRYVPVVAVPRTFNRQRSGSGWTRPAYRTQRSFQQPPPPVEEPDLHASMAEMRLRQPRLDLALALSLALCLGPALAIAVALALSLGPALAVAVALARTRQRIAGADPSSDGEGRGDNQRTLDAEGRGDNQRIAGRCAQTMVRGRGRGRGRVS